MQFFLKLQYCEEVYIGFGGMISLHWYLDSVLLYLSYKERLMETGTKLHRTYI